MLKNDSSFNFKAQVITFLLSMGTTVKHSILYLKLFCTVLKLLVFFIKSCYFKVDTYNIYLEPNNFFFFFIHNKRN